MNRIIAILSGAAICVCSFGCSDPADEIPVFEVTRGDFVHVLGIPGELKAVREVTISAPDLRGSLKVTSIIEEGTRVSPGDVLVEFDTSELEKDLESALSTLEVARTKIEQKRAQLEVKLSDLENSVTRTELNLERARMKVTDSETVPRVERESARIDVEQYTLEVERSRSSLESARLEGEAELQLLRLEASQAEARVQRVRDDLAKCTISAEGEGLVILPEIWKGGSRGKVTAGDTVWSGSAIITLPDMSEMQVESWVHEVDAGLVAADMPVQIVVDAYPDPPIAGHIDRIADLAVKRERGSKVKHLKATIALDETTDFMKPGMTVRSEIQIDAVPDVLSVPLEAVFSDGDERYVNTRGLGGWGRQDVALGAANDTHVIVESGLEPGDEVALIDPEGGPASVADDS